jgi:hypothetical protein
MSLSLLGDSSDEDLVIHTVPTSTTMVTLPSPQTPGPVEVQIISGTGSGGNTALNDGTGRLPAIDDSPPAPPMDEPPRQDLVLTAFALWIRPPPADERGAAAALTADPRTPERARKLAWVHLSWYDPQRSRRADGDQKGHAFV